MFKYPRGKEYLKPDTLRYKHETRLFITFEATEDCIISITVF